MQLNIDGYNQDLNVLSLVTAILGIKQHKLHYVLYKFVNYFLNKSIMYADVPSNYNN